MSISLIALSLITSAVFASPPCVSAIERLTDDTGGTYFHKILEIGDIEILGHQGADLMMLAATGSDGMIGTDYADPEDRSYALILLRVRADSTTDPAWDADGQVLYQSLGRSERPQLAWVGDLDGDDQIDLVLHHRRLNATTLYASSWAEPNALVAPVDTGPDEDETGAPVMLCRAP
jgi:hypothetical protein